MFSPTQDTIMVLRGGITARSVVGTNIAGKEEVESSKKLEKVINILTQGVPH
jgi:hypothetical protein